MTTRLAGVLLLGTVLIEPVWVSAIPLAGQEAKPLFREASTEVGITFVHENGASPEKRLPETMGGGVVLVDINNDSWIDLLFVNSFGLPFASGILILVAQIMHTINKSVNMFPAFLPEIGNYDT